MKTEIKENVTLFFKIAAAIICMIIVAKCRHDKQVEKVEKIKEAQIEEMMQNMHKNTPPSAPPSNYQTYPTTSSPSRSKGRMVRIPCSFCGGEGMRVSYSTPSYGAKGKFYCGKCGEYVNAGHIHKACPSCQGLGYNEKFVND